MENTFCQYVMSGYKHQTPLKKGTYSETYVLWGEFCDQLAKQLNLPNGARVIVDKKVTYVLSRNKMKKALKMGAKFVHKSP